MRHLAICAAATDRQVWPCTGRSLFRRIRLLITMMVITLAACGPTSSHRAVPAPGSQISMGPIGGARRLLVCNGSTRRCPRATHYRTVQAAVDAARPGNWILIWPGVYHEKDP